MTSASSVPRELGTAVIAAVALAGAAASTLAAGQPIRRSPDPSNFVALTHVTVVNPTSAAPERGMTVVVRGDYILTVGTDDRTKVPSGVLTIDGRGRFLMPGLWDSHVHLSYPGPCSLQRLIAGGVTSVRDLGGPPSENLEWRQQIEAGTIVGPHLYLAGLDIESAGWMAAATKGFATLSTASGAPAYPIWDWSPRFVMAGPSDAFQAVDIAVRSRMDVVKFRNLGADAFRALAAEARRRVIPLAGHAANGISLADAAEAGQRSVEHSQNLVLRLGTVSPREREVQYTRIARSGMFVTPTLVADTVWAPPEHVAALITDSKGHGEHYERHLSPHQMDVWESMLIGGKPDRQAHDRALAEDIEQVRLAHLAGVSLLAGTDLGTLVTYPGVSLHEELELLTDRVGLAPREALQAATTNAARFFNLQSEAGGVAAGMRADLVLLRQNPLTDIRNTRLIDAVLTSGHYYDSKALEAFGQCRSRIPSSKF